jgi:hypothetical protein
VLNHRHFAYTPLKNIWKGSISVSSTDISYRILFPVSSMTDGMNRSTNLAKVTFIKVSQHSIAIIHKLHLGHYCSNNSSVINLKF